MEAKDKYLSSLIPKRYQLEELTWDRVDSANKKIVEMSVDSLFTAHPKGLVLTGAVGTGKTAMCCLALESVADKLIELFTSQFKLIDGADISQLPDQYACWFHSQLSVLYITEFQLIRKITQWTKGKETWDWADYAKYQLIVLDDFGRAHRTDWSRTILDEFIDWLWSNNIPIWVSTNYHYEVLDEMRQPDSSSEYKRIVDRLLDPGWTMQLSTGNKSMRTRN